MKWQFSHRSRQDYDDLPPTLKRAFEKQVRLLAANLLHPSLRAKKYDERLDLWQARITRSWRFFFVIRDNAYIIVRILPHPK